MGRFLLGRDEWSLNRIFFSSWPGFDPAIHPFFEMLLRRVMDTRVKPAYDALLSQLLGFAVDHFPRDQLVC
jgi:hypothetical protein